jgi:ABC-type glycerol-3-phosphate transport system substrate-binding protein
MKIRKVLQVSLAALFTLAVFASCAKTEPNPSKDYNFAANEIVVAGTDFDNINSMAFNGEKFIISADKTDYPEDKSDYANYVYHNYLIVADEKNGIEKQIELSVLSENNTYSDKSYRYFTANKDGTVYALETHFYTYYDEDGRELRSTTHSIVKIDEDLNITPVLDIGKALDGAVTSLTNAYIADLKVSTDGNVYILIERDLYGVNIASGTRFLTKAEGEMNGFITGLVESPDGKMNVIMHDYTDGNVLKSVNTEDGSLGASVPFPVEDKTFLGGKKYPYYTYNSSYIYGVKNEEKATVSNLLTGGASSLEIRDIVYAADEKFAVLAVDKRTHFVGVYMLTKIDPKDVPDKEIVTIAALSTNYFQDYYIQEFNRDNDKYEVELKTYATEGLSYADQLTRFNADIAAGYIPDLLIIDHNMDYFGYVSKNMFMDLYPLFDEDPDISREDLVQSVMKAYETNGKLYSLPSHYVLYTLMGKTEIFGEEQGQTLAELMNKGQAVPGSRMFYRASANSILTSFVLASVLDYVNYETGECFFNTPEFISLLEAAKSIPANDSSTITIEDYYNERRALADGSVLLYDNYIGDFRAFSEARYTLFNAPITLLGYPNQSGGTGAYIMANDETAIMKDAKNPEGAWEFLKGFLQYKGPDDTATTTYSKNLSIMQKHIDNYAAEALEDPFFVDYTTGEKIYRDHMTIMNDELVVVPNNTVEENAQVLELLNSVTNVDHNDRALGKIIEEDAAPFFNGQKSAEETAAMIQNRVSTYLAERGN